MRQSLFQTMLLIWFTDVASTILNNDTNSAHRCGKHYFKQRY